MSDADRSGLSHMAALPHEPSVTVLRAVDVPGVSRPAWLVRVERPDGSTERRVRIAGDDTLPEVSR